MISDFLLRTYMIYRLTNTKRFSRTLFLIAALAGCGDSHSIGSCEGEKCIITNASEDQNCAIENTPLVRCEKYEEFIKTDKQLNVAYRDLRDKLNRSDANMLKSVQRHWITWRDQVCEDVEAEANCQAGACTGVAHDRCILSLTKTRRDELMSFLAEPRAAITRKFAFSQKKFVN